MKTWEEKPRLPEPAQDTWAQTLDGRVQNLSRFQKIPIQLFAFAFSICISCQIQQPCLINLHIEN